jgi:eukaryotic-like serine/threonine-protein kinase
MSLPSPGDIVADKYRLESLLAIGGMGAVFRARHVVMDTTVALKWLLPELVKSDEARERLVREARAVAQLRHSNVVQVYDVDTHEDSPFIVMELLEGETFEQLLSRGELPIARVIEVLLGAMAGLSAAHEHGIVHRDIKPENIFIAADRRHPDGVAKLVDFGISRSRAGAGDPRITQAGHAIGTPVYMSVEQLTRNDDIDHRTDIYSFGVVLYRALTGELPFDGETFAAVVLEIATVVPPSPKRLRPELPASLDRIVMKAMARRRDDRFGSIDELITALKAVELTSQRTPSAVFYPPNETPVMRVTTGQRDASAGADDTPDFRRVSRRSLYTVVAALLLGTAAIAGWASREQSSSLRTGLKVVPPPVPAAPLPAAPVQIPSGLEPPPLPSSDSLPRMRRKERPAETSRAAATREKSPAKVERSEVAPPAAKVPAKPPSVDERAARERVAPERAKPARRSGSLTRDEM